MVIYLPEGWAGVGPDEPARVPPVVKSVGLDQPSAAQAFRLLEGFEQLWRTSRLHVAAPIGFLHAYAMPAILLNQYLLVMEQGCQKPLGLCTWARMDRAAELRYLSDPTALARSDWCSGDRLWLIDWIGSASVNRLMAQWLKTRVLPSQILRTLRLREGQAQARILSFLGAQVDRGRAREILQSYHAEYAMPAQAAVPP